MFSGTKLGDGMNENKPCIYCGDPVSFPSCNECEDCWEVENRLDRYLKSEHGRDFVREHLAAAEVRYENQ